MVTEVVEDETVTGRVDVEVELLVVLMVLIVDELVDVVVVVEGANTVVLDVVMF
jgi:hypothetical protein